MPESVSCPECGTTLEVDDEYRTWKVRCPHCRHEFYPPDAGGRPGEDDEPRPRRRRRRDYDDEDDDPRAAARDVSGPATALKFVGWFGLVVSPIGLAIWVFLLVLVANAPPGQKNGGQQKEEVIAQAVFYIPQMVLAFVVSLVIVIGAGKMSRLESHGWAVAAAVVSMIPCVSPCCLLGLPFGIWAIAVLNRPHVQAAFRRTARRGSSRYDDDEE